MVVGGYPDAANNKSEIYDLSGQNSTYQTMTDNPIGWGSVGTFINNKSMVCGGSPYEAECYSYNIQVN